MFNLNLPYLDINRSFFGHIALAICILSSIGINKCGYNTKYHIPVNLSNFEKKSLLSIRKPSACYGSHYEKLKAIIFY